MHGAPSAVEKDADSGDEKDGKVEDDHAEGSFAETGQDDFLKTQENCFGSAEAVKSFFPFRTSPGGKGVLIRFFKPHA